MRLVASLAALALLAAPAYSADPPVIKSVKSGPWSAAATWEGNAVPGAGARVLVRTGHAVTYDVKSDAVIRGINVAGTLAFATDKDTVLNVGLLKIQPGEAYSEDGFDCDGHMEELAPGAAAPDAARRHPGRADREDRTHPVAPRRRAEQGDVPRDHLLRRPHGPARATAVARVGEARRDREGR